MYKSNLSNPKQERHLDLYYHDADYKKAWDSKHAHQHVQSETPLSNGSHANETKLVGGLYAKSNPNSFFNSYWFVVVTILVFIGLILLTNRVLGL